MPETKIINLIGAPGSGKSTTAFNLAGRMKLMGLNVDLAHEAAKDMTWEGRNEALACQPYVFGKQLFRIERLMGKVDWIVTDSPVLLSAIYGDEGFRWQRYVTSKYQSMPNITYLIHRTKKYNPLGRTQNEIEAAQLHYQIERLLQLNDIQHTSISGDDSAVGLILADLGLTSVPKGV